MRSRAFGGVAKAGAAGHGAGVFFPRGLPAAVVSRAVFSGAVSSAPRSSAVRTSAAVLCDAVILRRRDLRGGDLHGRHLASPILGHELRRRSAGFRARPFTVVCGSRDPEIADRQLRVRICRSAGAAGGVLPRRGAGARPFRLTQCRSECFRHCVSITPEGAPRRGFGRASIIVASVAFFVGQCRRAADRPGLEQLQRSIFACLSSVHSAPARVGGRAIGTARQRRVIPPLRAASSRRDTGG